jgi:hypothetical protein
MLLYRNDVAHVLRYVRLREYMRTGVGGTMKEAEKNMQDYKNRRG